MVPLSPSADHQHKTFLVSASFKQVRDAGGRKRLVISHSLKSKGDNAQRLFIVSPNKECVWTLSSVCTLCAHFSTGLFV